MIWGSLNRRIRSIVSSDQWELVNIETKRVSLSFFQAFSKHSKSLAPPPHRASNGAKSRDPRVRETGACRTGIGRRDRRGIKVAQAETNRSHDGDHDGTGGADDDGPEEGGLLAGRPGAVLEGGGPEVRCRHCDVIFDEPRRSERDKTLG